MKLRCFRSSVTVLLYSDDENRVGIFFISNFPLNCLLAIT